MEKLEEDWTIYSFSMDDTTRKIPESELLVRHVFPPTLKVSKDAMILTVHLDITTAPEEISLWGKIKKHIKKVIIWQKKNK